MGSTDFFDDDLIRQRDRATRIKMGPGDEPAPAKGGGAEEGVSRQVSDFNLTRMARHKQEVDEQATRALQEIEVLRKRQEQLEQEKRELEDARRKQEDFERGKREVTGSLQRSLTMLERDYLETQRQLELMASTRGRFRELLSELESIQEDAWPEDRVHEELLRGLAVVEEAREDYNKSMARLDAVSQGRGPGSEEVAAVRFESRGSGGDGTSVMYWLKVGLGVTGPLAGTLVVLFLIYLMLALNGWL
ncbi:MAG TPA: hypothetical protein PKE55_10455 [Kiritimatiellia bacterium]|nr:hypothetical protein [Kiritimatiellia bacterium]